MRRRCRADARPLLAIDLLATFYDESVRVDESRRLLAGCVTHLQRLSQGRAGGVSARPPAAPISRNGACCLRPCQEGGGRRVAAGAPAGTPGATLWGTGA